MLVVRGGASSRPRWQLHWLKYLGYVFLHAQQNGIALAGQPLTRYLEWGPGLWTIEAGMPVAANVGENASQTDVRADTLPGGFVATTTHAGSIRQVERGSRRGSTMGSKPRGSHHGGSALGILQFPPDPADYPDPKGLEDGNLLGP